MAQSNLKRKGAGKAKQGKRRSLALEYYSCNSAEEFQVNLTNYKTTGKAATCFLVSHAPYFGIQHYYVFKNHIPAKLCFTVSEISVHFFFILQETTLF